MSVAGFEGRFFRLDQTYHSQRETGKEVVPRLPEPTLAALRHCETCMVANAIESFHVRLRNAGYADSRVRCMFEEAPPMVGYAMTARLSSGEPPIVGGAFHDRADLWKNILEIPAPRILVLEDMDKPPGRGAFVGNMHAAILKALGCVGYVTNGAVRELPSVREMGLQMFAGNVAVSHAYAHIFEIGCAAEIGGMEVRPGDLLHGDRHGVLTIPADIAPEIPAVAAKLQEAERKVIEFCQSSDFSVGRLRQIEKTKG
jgi:4-hydroxy-4-methyl-2-oxoglutarate aldolase